MQKEENTSGLPEGWRETTLGNIVEIKNGGTPSTKNLNFWGGNIGWITPKDLSGYHNIYISEGDRNITEEGLKNCSSSLLPKNTILFTSRAPIGYVAIAANQVATNQGFKNIICDEVETHFKFFYYLLKYKSSYIESLSSGSTFSEASATLMKSIDIFLPPLSTQKSIAKILSSFDDKIELLREQNETLEKMGQEIFREWFGKYKVGDELPEGWRSGKIKDLINILSGFAFKSQNFTEFGSYGLVTIKNVQNGSFVKETKDKLNNTPEKMPDYCILTTGDILLSLTGNVGRVCHVIGEKYLLNQRVAKLEPKNIKDSSFVYLFFRQKSTLNILEKISSGTAQQNLSPIKTSILELIIPNRETLNDFGNIANPKIIKILSNLEQIEKLSKTRDLLLPKLIKGEVLIGDLER